MEQTRRSAEPQRNKPETTAPLRPKVPAGRNLENRPLSDVIVLEHCEGVAGEFAGHLLHLLGAAVIKIDDKTRAAGSVWQEPPLISHEGGRVGALFAYLNAGKKSIALDLQSESDRNILKPLLASAAVILDDSPADRRAANGLDWEHVHHISEAIVYTSVRPFGCYGRHSHYRGEEINVFHSGGEGYLLPNGLAYELAPEREPLKAYGHLGELQGGLSAALATLAVLTCGTRTAGEFIDVSLQDANVALSGMTVQRYADGVLETRQNRSFRYGGVLPCIDGYVEILVLEQHQWQGLVKMLGEPSWTENPELDDPIYRGEHGAEINNHIREWASTRTVAEVVQLARMAQVPCGKFNAPSDLLISGQLQARSFFSKIALPGRADLIAVPGLPFQIDGASLATREEVPLRPGMNATEILETVTASGPIRLAEPGR